MTKELLQAVHGQVSGVYLIPPAGRYDPLVEVLEWLRSVVPSPVGPDGGA